MKSFPDRILLLILDQLMITVSFVFAYWLSYYSGLSPDKPYHSIYWFWDPYIVINILWLLLFGMFGLYGKWKNTSRFDEIISVYKTITIGAIAFLVLTFSQVFEISAGKLITLGYWATLVVLVGAGRLTVRSIQRSLLSHGVGRRPSIIVGDVRHIVEMLKNLKNAPALGYDVKGVIPIERGKQFKKIDDFEVLGSVKDLHSIIENYRITDVLIALEFKEEDEIFKLVSAADSYDVDFSILPGPADVLSGRMMFNQLYGFPMVRILSEPIPPWEKNVKRLIDVCFALTVIVLLFPLFCIVAVVIKLESKGPVFYIQERVGYRGKIFKLWKFRSMVADAEKHSGPVWAEKNDSRMTRFGRIIRKMRIDELPQMYNILKGDMSLVGPRPERDFFVEQLKKKIPYYPLRLKVKPGLTGWAQTKHNYDRSLDDVREKLKYDLYYIENMSLSMDFKIIIATIFVVLGAKGAH
ncbi:MAG: sugar transferase [Candidatus Latescibacteria bacterium]|nr:sugar transferase [Candidatus Latescibacterota bacterium]